MFARATRLACEGAVWLRDEIEVLKDEWRTKADQPRVDSAAAKLIELLPVHPVLDLAAATDVLGVSHQAAGAAIRRLETAGVLQEITKRTWGRTWECAGLFRILDAFERDIAGPDRSVKRVSGRAYSRVGGSLP